MYNLPQGPSKNVYNLPQGPSKNDPLFEANCQEMKQYQKQVMAFIYNKTHYLTDLCSITNLHQLFVLQVSVVWWVTTEY